MAQFPSLTLTQAGIEMIATSQGGAELIFTCMKMGEGDSTGVEIMELEDLIAPKITINISTIDTSGTPGQISLTATVSNADLDNGFFTKELGVFAKIGSSGTEKLYAYTNAGSLCDYMPSKATPIDENTIRATMVVANNANTTAIIDSSVVYVTAAEVNARISAHNADASAHSAAIGAHNTTTDAHANRFANYLPLAGGTMTGVINFTNTDVLKKNDNDTYIVLMGGKAYGQGASLVLGGKDANLTQAKSGDFSLMSADGTKYANLYGNADGKLAWTRNNREVEIKSMAFPSATKISAIGETTQTGGIPYTAPANGFFTISTVNILGSTGTDTAYVNVFVNGFAYCHFGWNTNTLGGKGYSNTIPVKKGDNISVELSWAKLNAAYFIYAEGEV